MFHILGTGSQSGAQSAWKRERHSEQTVYWVCRERGCEGRAEQKIHVCLQRHVFWTSPLSHLALCPRELEWLLLQHLWHSCDACALVFQMTTHTSSFLLQGHFMKQSKARRSMIWPGTPHPPIKWYGRKKRPFHKYNRNLNECRKHNIFHFFLSSYIFPFLSMII